LTNYFTETTLPFTMGMLTTKEAAKRLNKGIRAIQALIAKGSLRASKIGRDWFVDERDLDFIIENVRPGPTELPTAVNIDKAVRPICDRLESKFKIRIDYPHAALPGVIRGDPEHLTLNLASTLRDNQLVFRLAYHSAGYLGRTPEKEVPLRLSDFGELEAMRAFAQSLEVAITATLALVVSRKSGRPAKDAQAASPAPAEKARGTRGKK
jgi:excisionase family DNA binding protein